MQDLSHLISHYEVLSQLSYKQKNKEFTQYVTMCAIRECLRLAGHIAYLRETSNCKSQACKIKVIYDHLSLSIQLKLIRPLHSCKKSLITSAISPL